VANGWNTKKSANRERFEIAPRDGLDPTSWMVPVNDWSPGTLTTDPVTVDLLVCLYACYRYDSVTIGLMVSPYARQ